MANLQIKGIENRIYEEIKQMAADEGRSVSQQVLFLLKEHLANRHQTIKLKTPARTLLELSGSWVDDRDADSIILEIKRGRKSSRRLQKGL